MSCFGLEVVSSSCKLLVQFSSHHRKAYIIIGLILIVLIKVWLLITEVVLIEALEVIVVLFVLKSLSGEPVNGMWNEFLLNVLSQVVVELKAAVNLGSLLLGTLKVLSWWGWWAEEVEERLGWDSLLENSGLLGV